MQDHSPVRTGPRTLPLLAAALLTGALPLTAQDPAPAAPDERVCTCDFDFGALRELSFARAGRARLGVSLGEPEQVDGRWGIRLQDVQAGGPADRAGVRAGDVLIEIDGQPLDDEPADRVLDLMSDVEPGDTVAVTYVRDGRRVTAQVETDAMRGLSFFRGPGEGVRVFPGRGMPRIHERLHAIAPHGIVRFGHGALHLVPMNEGLGAYFGASEGVLVAEIDQESSLGLRAGDVLLSIDGRAVEDPAHAHGILGSYRPDETISLEVMRDRRRMTVRGSRDSR